MTELNPLLVQWHGTLLHLARVFGSASDVHQTNLYARAANIVKLSQEYRKELNTPLLRQPDVRQRRSKIPGAGAMEAAAEAMERLEALIDAGSYVERTDDGAWRGYYDIKNKLHLRWLKLLDLRKELRNVNMARYEMEATVPIEFYARILAKSARTRPQVQPEQALAVITLYHAGVDARYAASVIDPLDLNDENAARVIQMYADGIPAEFASVLA